jgi:hypothetical protein
MSAEAASEAAVDPFVGTRYEGSPEGWWTAYGGALDVKSGVVYFPGPNYPPCNIPDCSLCARRRGETP